MSIERTSDGPAAGATPPATTGGLPDVDRPDEAGPQGVSAPPSEGGAPHQQRRRLILGGAALLVVAALVALLLWPLYGPPALVLQTPAPVPASSRDEITVDVTLTGLPDGVYPAASLTVGFDPSKLEFVGVKQGTMTTLNGSSPLAAIPIWSSDAEHVNRQGRVATMYLDTTAGAFAYTGASFDAEKRDVLLRLSFRLRDSAQAGDDLPLTVVDAVLATADNATTGTSLATARRTLRAYPARILVQA